MELKNYMEILMWQQLDDVLASHQGVCKCEKCRYDIAALTMNFLPPRYVVTDQGQMFTKNQSAGTTVHDRYHHCGHSCR